MNTKLRLSKFVHAVPMSEDYVAVFNAANLAVIFLSVESWDSVKSLSNSVELDAFLYNQPTQNQAEWGATINQMKLWQMLLDETVDELSLIKNVASQLTGLPVGVLYLLLTDICNFACRYCFIEGGLDLQHKFKSMTLSTAKRGIDAFVKALEEGEHSCVEPSIILYGGEPLTNWKVIDPTLGYIKSLIDEGRLPAKTTITINTNGSLITREIAEELAKHDVFVAISFDGMQVLHDTARPFHDGSGTFSATMRGMTLLREAGVNWGVSCVVSEFNVHRLEEVLRWFASEFALKSLGFNIRRETAKYRLSNSMQFAEEASVALIHCFLIARDLGIYEDRMMRSVNAFIEGKPRLNDCAGCGQQIVVAPDGRVGPCQGFYGSNEYFVDLSPDFNPYQHPIWAEWRQRSPYNMEQCYDCIALGMCGGGCPQQAFLQHGSIWELDELSCVHSKKSLDFLLHELFEMTRSAKDSPLVSRATTEARTLI